MASRETRTGTWVPNWDLASLVLHGLESQISLESLETLGLPKELEKS